MILILIFLLNRNIVFTTRYKRNFEDLNFDILKDNGFEFDHKPLTLILNIVMHKSPIKENNGNQRHLFFDKNKAELFLKHLNNELNIISYKNNIQYLYQNFTTTFPSFMNTPYFH
jgi:hypothetical protein